MLLRMMTGCYLRGKIGNVGSDMDAAVDRDDQYECGNSHHAQKQRRVCVVPRCRHTVADNGYRVRNNIFPITCSFKLNLCRIDVGNVDLATYGITGKQ